MSPRGALSGTLGDMFTIVDSGETDTRHALMADVMAFAAIAAIGGSQWFTLWARHATIRR